MNENQRLVLWLSVVIIDFVGLLILYDRVVHKKYNFDGDSGIYFTWSATDFLIILMLMAITSMVVIYSLKDQKPKDGQAQ